MSAMSLGTPPIHTWAALIIMLTACLTSLPSFESIDKDATIEAFTATSIDGVSTAMLGVVRLFFFLIIAGVTLYRTGEDFVQLTSYLKHSKLRSAPIPIRGLTTQVHFTPCAWNLLGISFLLSGTICMLVSYGHSELIQRNPWLLRCALLTFETAAPAELLTAIAVKYAIWPKLLKEGGPDRTIQLKRFTSLMQHNACVFFVLAEVALLGKIPFRMSDMSVAPLFGIAYVLFSWFMANRWAPKARGPQFLYFFLDTTLGKTTTIALLSLLAVLLTVYTLFSLGGGVVSKIPSLPARIAIISVVSGCVCRFRD